MLRHVNKIYGWCGSESMTELLSRFNWRLLWTQIFGGPKDLAVKDCLGQLVTCITLKYPSSMSVFLFKYSKKRAQQERVQKTTTIHQKKR
jgi:hypothetical protein